MKKKSLLLLVLLLLAKSLNCQFGHNHDITNSHVILISIRASFQMIFLSQYIIFSKPFFLIGRGEKIVEKKKKKKPNFVFIIWESDWWLIETDIGQITKLTTNTHSPLELNCQFTTLYYHHSCFP